ncbi:MAG: 30S ribosomal protein S20 [Candidatus Aureabacteria bacterium]|nr:30S ribosomal protein S20 [Candidatus Auribacterota bacterium]
MPNISSAKKRMRNSEKKRLKNKAIKSSIKTLSSKIIKLHQEGKKDEALKTFKAVSSIIDKASAKGIIHKNTAGHKKSNLSKMFK